MTNKVNKDRDKPIDIDFKRKNTLGQIDAGGGYSFLEGKALPALSTGFVLF